MTDLTVSPKTNGVWVFIGVQLFRVERGILILSMMLPIGFFFALLENIILLILYLMATITGAWCIGYVFQKKAVLLAHYKALKDSTDAQWVKKDDMLFKRLDELLGKHFKQFIQVLDNE